MILALITAFLILLLLILLGLYSVSSDMLSQVQNLEFLLDKKYVNILTNVDLFKQVLEAKFTSFDQKFITLTEKLEILKEFSHSNGISKPDYNFYYFLVLLTVLGVLFLYINSNPQIILDLISSTCETSKVHSDHMRNEIADRVVNTIMKTSGNSNDLLLANQVSNRNCILESVKVQFDLQAAKTVTDYGNMTPVPESTFWKGTTD